MREITNLGPVERAKSLWQGVRRDLADNGGAPLPLHARDVGVMVLTCISLTLFHYFGKPAFYHQQLAGLAPGWLGLAGTSFESLAPYVYWALSSLAIRVLLPIACIALWFGESPRDYGFRMWERGHGGIYLGLYLVMLPVLVIVSNVPAFQAKYPFYDGAGQSWGHFLAYELTYGAQFAALEAFFRGFLIFALFKRFGYQAVVIMTIPYCMIHFGKPIAETFGSIIAGLLLGYLALKSRSWLPGALLHWGVGLTLDALCVWDRLTD